jgi:Protein of unknown function (DUF1631)
MAAQVKVIIQNSRTFGAVTLKYKKMKSTAILQKSINDTAELFKPALEKCTESVIVQLQDAENKCTKVTERQLISSAWRELAQNVKILGLQFNDDLLESFNLNAAIAAETIRTTKPEALANQRGTAAALSSFLPKNETSKHAHLTLVDDADVSHAISSGRFLQQILPRVDAQLEELNKLISALQGLPTVRADLNPLRPEVFVQTLIKLIATVASEPAIGLLWITYFAQPLGQEVNAVYEQIIKQLRQQSVKALQYKVIPTASYSSGGSMSGAARAGDRVSQNAALDYAPAASQDGMGYGGAPISQYDQIAPYGNGAVIEDNRDLLKDFIYGGGGTAHYKLPASYHESQQQILAELMTSRASQPALADYSDDSTNSAYLQLPVVDRPVRSVDAQTQLNQKIWGDYGLAKNRAIVRTQLKTQAKEVGQVLSLEMVRKLVNKVAQDSRLLRPVREAIVALEPSLLRLAMVDPRFFTDEEHPARRLMERVAQRSFKYNDEFSAEFKEFFASITRTFNQLNMLDIENALPFKEALVILDVEWGQQDQLVAEQQARALAAVRFAEQRQTLAGEIAFEISHRPDLDGVPGPILDFLFESWSLAMAHARLTDKRNQIDPEGFNSVVFDLVWSVKRAQTIKQPSKLIRMIPGLLGKLHYGLDLIGKDRQESQPFFDLLMKLHEPVLNLRRVKTSRDAHSTDFAVIDDLSPEATPEQRLAKRKEQPWLGKAEAIAFGFEDTFVDTQDEPTYFDEPADSIDQAKAATETVQSSAVTSSELSNAPPLTQKPIKTAAAAPVRAMEPDQAMQALKVGVWVDLYSQERWTRAQLIWVNEKSTFFMFSSHGGQPHSMTRRRCERLVADNLLRPLQMHGVVEQALHSVTGQLFDASQPAALLA